MYIIPITDEQIVFTTAIPNGSGHHRSMCTTTTPTYIYKYVALIVIIRLRPLLYICRNRAVCRARASSSARAVKRKKIIEPHTRRPLSAVKVVEASVAAAVCRPQQPASIEAYVKVPLVGQAGGHLRKVPFGGQVTHTHARAHNIICYIMIYIYVLYYYVYFLAGKIKIK